MRRIFTKLLFFPACAIMACSLGVSADLPEPDWGKADTIPIEKVPDISPPAREELADTIKKGVDFLLSTQNSNGSWGSYKAGGMNNLWVPAPCGAMSFQTASTALCIIGLESSPLSSDPRVQEAISRAEDFLLKEMPKLKRHHDYLFYNVWGHAYVLEALSLRASKLHKESARYKELRECAEQQVKWLNQLCVPQGGWGYIQSNGWAVKPDAKSTGFTTATVFVAVKAAEKVFDLKLDKKVEARSLQFLKDQRTPAGTYVYSASHMYRPASEINRHTGSLARSPACDLAIKLFDDKYISCRQMIDGIERLWSRTGWLNMSLKKPKPHESFAKNSGYFVFYGYYYTALCFDLLPGEILPRHASHMTNGLVALQEKDGSWWDYPCFDYHKYYGTGFVLFSLSRGWDVLYGDSSPTQMAALHEDGLLE